MFNLLDLGHAYVTGNAEFSGINFSSPDLTITVEDETVWLKTMNPNSGFKSHTEVLEKDLDHFASNDGTVAVWMEDSEYTITVRRTYQFSTGKFFLDEKGERKFTLTHTGLESDGAVYGEFSLVPAGEGKSTVVYGDTKSNLVFSSAKK